MSKAVDPVCGMEVDKGGEHFTTYEGMTYYFCCPACLNKFSKDPIKYSNHDSESSSDTCSNHGKSKQHEGCCGKHHH